MEWRGVDRISVGGDRLALDAEREARQLHRVALVVLGHAADRVAVAVHHAAAARAERQLHRPSPGFFRGADESARAVLADEPAHHVADWGLGEGARERVLSVVCRENEIAIAAEATAGVRLNRIHSRVMVSVP